MGSGGGAAVLTAQFWGRKDTESIKKTIVIMIRICLGIVMVFTLATIFFSRQIMGIYTTDAEVIEYGVIYFKVSLPTYFLMGISLTLTLMLRSMRKVNVPLITSIVCFFVNVFFNWVFIFGNLGMPQMQIAGAALGTLIARVVELLMIGSYFFFIEKDIGFKLKDLLLPCKSLIKTYLHYSIHYIYPEGYHIL